MPAKREKKVKVMFPPPPGEKEGEEEGGWGEGEINFMMHAF